MSNDRTSPVTTSNIPFGWNKVDSFEVKLTAVDYGDTIYDAPSGVLKTYYTTDGSDPSTSSSSGPVGGGAQFSVADQGITTVKYFSIDNNGNAEQIRTNLLRLNNIGPVTVYSTVPSSPDGTNGWFKTNSTITLSVFPTSCVTYYKWDSGSFQTYSSPFHIPSVEGIHSLEFYSKDELGNIEDIQTAFFKFDDTAPVSQDDAPFGLQTQPLTVNLFSSDNASGVENIYYTTDGTDPTTSSQSGTSVVIAASGSPAPLYPIFLKYFSVDFAGNQEPINTAIVNLFLNTEIPQIYISENFAINGKHGWYTSSPLITLAAVGPQGIKEILYKLYPVNNATTAKYTSTVDISSTVDLSQNYLINIEIDQVTTLQINVRGAISSQTTIIEIINAINNTFGSVIATQTDKYGSSTGAGYITLTSPTGGTGSATSEINFLQPTSNDATLAVFGLDSAYPHTFTETVVFIPYTSPVSLSHDGIWQIDFYAVSINNTMTGTITSYDSGTGALVVEITSMSGYGTYSAWSITSGINTTFSTTSLTISKGTQNLTVGLGLALTAGQEVVIRNTSGVGSKQYKLDSVLPVTYVINSFRPDANNNWYKTSPLIGFNPTDSLSGIFKTFFQWDNGIVSELQNGAMSGVVASYNSGTGALSVDITNTTGSGTFNSWLVSDNITFSNTSLTISTGLKTLTVGLNLNLQSDQQIIVCFDNDNLMTGTVVSYNSGSGVLEVNVTSIIGSGTYDIWTVLLVDCTITSSITLLSINTGVQDLIVGTGLSFSVGQQIIITPQFTQIPKEGIHLLKVYSEDMAGNVGEIQSFTYKLSQTGPATTDNTIFYQGIIYTAIGTGYQDIIQENSIVLGTYQIQTVNPNVVSVISIYNVTQSRYYHLESITGINRNIIYLIDNGFPLSVSDHLEVTYFYVISHDPPVLNTNEFCLTVPPFQPYTIDYDANIRLYPTDESTNEIEVTYYTIDGSIPTINSLVYDPTIGINLTTSGTYVIKYFSINIAGNVESPKTAQYRVIIDKDIPVLDVNLISDPSLNGWYGIKNSSSTTPLTISVGTKTLFIDSGLTILQGQQVVITYDTNNVMTGVVSSYDSIIGQLVANITNIIGIGTGLFPWVVSIQAFAIGVETWTSDRIFRYNETATVIDSITLELSNYFVKSIELIETSVTHQVVPLSGITIIPGPTGFYNRIQVATTLPIISTTAGYFVIGGIYTIVSIGSTNFTLIGASSNTVGVTFTATGVGSGTGTVKEAILVDYSHYIGLDRVDFNLDSDLVTAGNFVVGQSYIITFVGTTDFTLIGASSNTIGVAFTATGTGSGTGTAIFSVDLKPVYANLSKFLGIKSSFSEQLTLQGTIGFYYSVITRIPIVEGSLIVTKNSTPLTLNTDYTFDSATGKISYLTSVLITDVLATSYYQDGVKFGFTLLATPGQFFLNEGIHTIYSKSYDRNSVLYSDEPQKFGTQSTQFKLDRVIPVTTDNVLNVGWQISPVTVRLFPYDIGSGIDKTYYTTNGSDPTTSSSIYDVSTGIILTATGVYTIKYFSTDKAGNTENIKSAAYQVWVDASLPVSNYTISPSSPDGNDGWYITDPTIHITASDPDSGIAAIYYRVNSGPLSNYDPSGILVPFQGLNTIEFYSVDNVGNIEYPHHQIDVKWDNVPPSTTTDITSNYTSSSIIRFISNDASSGYDTTYYTTDGSTPTTSSSNGSFVLTGTFLLKFFSTDKAGNQEAVQSHQFYFDFTPPQITNFQPIGCIITDSTTEITFDITDDLSGVDIESVYLNVDGIIYSTTKNSSKFSYVEHSPLSYSITLVLDSQDDLNFQNIDILIVNAKDNVENATSLEFNFVHEDTIPPWVCQVWPAPNVQDVSLNSNIAALIDDDLSGVDIKSVRISVNAVDFNLNYRDVLNVQYTGTASSAILKVYNYTFTTYIDGQTDITFSLYEGGYNTIQKILLYFNSLANYSASIIDSKLAQQPSIFLLNSHNLDILHQDNILHLSIPNENSNFSFIERANGYLVFADPSFNFQHLSPVNVIINASDNSGNSMVPFSYVFIPHVYATPSIQDRNYVNQIALQYIQNLQANIASNYVHSKSTEFYGHNKAICLELGRHQQQIDLLNKDRSYSTLTEAYLYDKLGYLLYTMPTIGMSHDDYRALLQSLILILFQGSLKSSLEQGISLLTDLTVNITELVFAPGSDISEQFMIYVDLLLDSAPLAGVDLIVLSNNLAHIFELVKPAHIFIVQRFVWTEPEVFHLQDEFYSITFSGRFTEEQLGIYKDTDNKTVDHEYSQFLHTISSTEDFNFHFGMQFDEDAHSQLMPSLLILNDRNTYLTENYILIPNRFISDYVNVTLTITTFSSSSLTISSGIQNLTAITGLIHLPTGLEIIIKYDDSNLMSGTIISYNSSTGDLSVNITAIVGSGTYSSWSGEIFYFNEI
jgi:hypothetical protein